MSAAGPRAPRLARRVAVVGVAGWIAVGALAPAPAGALGLVDGACSLMQVQVDPATGALTTTVPGLCEKAGLQTEVFPVSGFVTGTLAGDCNSSMTGSANLFAGNSAWSSLSAQLLVEGTTATMILTNGVAFAGVAHFPLRAGCLYSLGTVTWEDPQLA